MAYCSRTGIQKMRQKFSGPYMASESHGVWIHPHQMDPSLLVSAYSGGNLPYQLCYPSQPQMGYMRGCPEANFYHQVPYHPANYHASHFPVKSQQNYSSTRNNSKTNPNVGQIIPERRNNFLTKHQEINKNENKNRTTNQRGPLREWRVKVPPVRYDSDDSGIAESPNSMTSSMTWHSYDEGAMDLDECCKSFEQKLNIDEGNSNQANADSILEEQNEKVSSHSGGKETFWSVSDDACFWRRMRHKPPSNYVINRIVDQIEYYLSDDYLLKDKYLLRQIRCKKDGYVSIKLITSFKKVKKLTKDWAVVRSAIVRRSNQLVVSSEGHRIKRRKELCEDLRKPRLLTSILVIRLPQEYNAVDRVTSLFSGFGEIGYVRLLRADKNIPVDLRNYATQVPDIGQSLCAVVDFESAEDSLKAVRVLKYIQRQHPAGDDESEIRDEIESIAKYRDILKDLPPLGDTRLALLGPRVRRTLYRQDRVSESLEEEIETFTETNQQMTDTKPERALPNEYKQNLSKSPPTRRVSYKVHLSDSNGMARLRVIRQPKGPEDGRGFTKKRSNTK